MSEKKKNLKKLRSKYRLVIINDDTFEEKVSITLSRLNVFVSLGSLFLVLIIGTTLLISFTPLREYIPGYASTDLRRNTLVLAIKADSLELELEKNQMYLQNIQNVLNGEPIDPIVHNDEGQLIETPNITNTLSPEDSILRKYVEEEEQFTVSTSNEELINYTFFSPLKGVISSKYNPKEGHLAIDLNAPPNTPVKSCLKGTIIYSGWSSETGYTLIVQHNSNLISVYKHNSALLKKQGDLVQSGEAIAIIGNSGSETTGPHLHFELWHHGHPVDPQDYISF